MESPQAIRRPGKKSLQQPELTPFWPLSDSHHGSARITEA
jgi:hypothetical protein